MTRKQRQRKRWQIAAQIAKNSRCPECGEPGKHWVSAAQSMFPQRAGLCYKWQEALMLTEQSSRDLYSGFWICNKFYGPDGRRLDV